MTTSRRTTVPRRRACGRRAPETICVSQLPDSAHFFSDSCIPGGLPSPFLLPGWPAGLLFIVEVIRFVSSFGFVVIVQAPGCRPAAGS